MVTVNTILKKNVKLILFVDNMILYMENPTEPTKKTTKIIKWACQCCRIQGQYFKKSIVFFYTSNEQSHSKIKKTIPFAIGSKQIKYLGRRLTKEVHDLYAENYRTLLRGVKKTVRDALCAWVRRCNVAKRLVLSNSVYGFYTNPLKIPADFYVEIDIDSKICIKMQKAQNSHKLFGKKKVGGHSLPDFRT